MIEIGTLLEGKYQILEQIGSGGGGIVYLAYHHGLQKHVVVKEIKGAFVSQINTRLEVDILKQLQHGSLPQVYDFVAVDHQVYTVMQHIDGYDLDYYRKNGYHLSESQLVEWLRQLLDVLDYLHSQPTAIIHSDIKPANVMINSKGIACLIDFNISIDTDDSMVKGASLEYAAPEQIAALYQRMQGVEVERALSVKTDLYSLGLTFYAIMTGVIPSQNRQELYPIQSYQMGYSEAFIAIIHKLMNENPSKRYGSAKKAAYALEMMEKKPSEKLRRWNIATTIAYGLLMMISVCMCLIGVSDNWSETYSEDYEAMQQAYTTYEVQNVREIGFGILENNRYTKLLNQNEEQEAEIYYMIGESYYWEENYTKALIYYEEAIAAAEGEESVYYRDAVICMAKQGDYTGATLLLEEGSAEGIASDDLSLAEAEIKLQENQIEESKELYVSLINESNDDDIVYRASIELASIYEAEEDWENAVLYLEKADAINHNTLILRKLGIAYSNCAVNATDRDSELVWNDQAKFVYEELTSMPDRSYEDCLNYALVYELSGEYLKAVEVLQMMEEDYPEDYGICKRMCYVLYYIESQKSVDNRDYSKIHYYYEKAAEQYAVIEASGVEDTEMIQLEQLMNSL